MTTVVTFREKKNARELDSYVSNNGWYTEKKSDPYIYFFDYKKKGNIFSKGIYFNQF